MQTQQYPTFRKGWSDFVVDPPPGYGRTLDNVNLDFQGKPYQRYGSDFWDATAPRTTDTARVSAFFKQPTAPTYYNLFIFSPTHLYYIPHDTTAGAVPTAALTAVSQFGGAVFFASGSATTRFYPNQWGNDHVLVSIDRDINASYLTSGGDAANLVYFDNGGTARTRFAGSPALDGTTVHNYKWDPSAGANTTIVNSGNTFNYVYYLCAVIQYFTLSGTFYAAYGVPQLKAIGTSQAMGTGGTQVTFNNLPTMPSGSGWDNGATAIQIFVFRTQNNGTAAYFLFTVTNGTATSFADTTTDAVLIGGAPFYMNDGTLQADMPPLCRYSTVMNGTGYFASTNSGTFWNVAGVSSNIGTGTNLSNRVRQCSPGSVDSSPTSFFLDFEDSILGLSNLDYFPVVFLKSKVYRVEGNFDSKGNGAMVPRLITGSTGIVAGTSIVRVGRYLYFAGTDGFYYTDGFSAVKISKHLDQAYRAITTTFAQGMSIHGKYNPDENRIYWGTRSTNSASDNDGVWILDLNLTEGQDGVFTTWSGGPFSASFFPTAFESVGSKHFLRGDKNGYIFSHARGRLNDYFVKYITQASYVPVCPTVTTPGWSAGDSAKTKWMNKIYFSLKHLALGNTTASLQWAHERDLSGTWYNTSVFLKTGLSGSQSSLFRARRFLQKGASRFNTVSVQLSKSYTNIYKSDTLGTASVSAGTTVTLDAGNWPQWLAGATSIVFQHDNYVTEFPITNWNGTNQLTVSGMPPALANQKWMIHGYATSEDFYWDNLELATEVFDESNVLGHTNTEDNKNT